LCLTTEVEIPATADSAARHPVRHDSCSTDHFLHDHCRTQADRRGVRRDDPLHLSDSDPQSHEVGGAVRRPLRPVLNPEAWEWYRTHGGGGTAPVVDTWWQTGTGHILITPLPGITSPKPGSAQQPFPGVWPEIRDDDGNRLGPDQPGNLLVTAPWPGMMRGLYQDVQRYRATYWSKYPDAYFAGDGAKYDRDGDITLMGRIDDVTDVSPKPPWPLAEIPTPGRPSSRSCR
jgi:hypothetical protein